MNINLKEQFSTRGDLAGQGTLGSLGGVLPEAAGVRGVTGVLKCRRAPPQTVNSAEGESLF